MITHYSSYSDVFKKSFETEAMQSVLSDNPEYLATLLADTVYPDITKIDKELKVLIIFQLNSVLLKDSDKILNYLVFDCKISMESMKKSFNQELMQKVQSMITHHELREELEPKTNIKKINQRSN